MTLAVQLIFSTVVAAILATVYYYRERLICALENLFPDPLQQIADPTPPTSPELRGIDFLIPEDVRAHAALHGKTVVAGDSPPADTSVLWYDGPLLDEAEPGCSCPHAATHGHLGGCALDTNLHYAGPPALVLTQVPVRREFAKGGPISGGVTFWLNEYMISPSPRARETRRDPITGEILNPAPVGCRHLNPEPVTLTTGEVVAGVCPDCLQPLPPASVGSDWKP